MKAKNKNIVVHNREKLEEVLPLNMPFSVALDSCNLCNFKCKFCAIQNPATTLTFKKQFMGLKLFKKIIDDFTEFPHKLKVLRLAGQGEPLLNPDYIEMIEYAKEKNVADWIETVTNGSRLSPAYNERLVDSGIDRIRISIEAVDEDGYFEMAGVKIDFEEFVSNIEDLYGRSRGKCEIYIKTVDAAVDTNEKKEKFYEVFGNICDTIFVDHVIPLWSDFEELSKNFKIDAKGMHGQELKQVKI